MNLSEWKNFLIPYEYAVEELKVKFKNIRKELRDSHQYSPIEFVTGRVKKVSSMIDKAKRLDIELTEDELLEKMEDIAGIRIMCQFVEDIYTVAHYIRQRNDMSVEYEKDYISNFKESGYRSYHMIINYPIQTVHGPINILAEIQIRTLAMNFWATIEHSLKYKYNHYLPKDLSDRLRKAADAAFKLDEEMSKIRDEIVQAQMLFELKSVTINVIIADINQIKNLGMPEEAKHYLERFEQIDSTYDFKKIIELQKELKEFLSKHSN